MPGRPKRRRWRPRCRPRGRRLPCRARLGSSDGSFSRLPPVTYHIALLRAEAAIFSSSGAGVARQPVAGAEVGAAVGDVGAGDGLLGVGVAGGVVDGTLVLGDGDGPGDPVLWLGDGVGLAGPLCLGTSCGGCTGCVPGANSST